MRTSSSPLFALLLAAIACGPKSQPAAPSGVVAGPRAADCYDGCMEGLQKKDPEEATMDPEEALATCRAACGTDRTCADACTVEHTRSAEEETKQDVATAHKTCAALCGG
jgi:hypothetical protein